ncbi:hypothetical protein AAFC00_005886 [Neodothiora populina]|uniref:F-box domain-containing protein n=1 Tax=Neodothiora populina TaxID=2781224 RepID=A0ABR3P667_9PEZI
MEAQSALKAPSSLHASLGLVERTRDEALQQPTTPTTGAESEGGGQEGGSQEGGGQGEMTTKGSSLNPATALPPLPDTQASSSGAAHIQRTEAIRKPLGLLDLPVDILKEVVKQFTHTNDLTSLALCHSALHRLVIPHIYSRFDIVWPDTVTPTEPRTGVDALTYGLATLVMAHDVFGEESPFVRPEASDKTGENSDINSRVRRRKGNYYAHFTRKFSLGNGPPEWTQEYLISKEAGKMLGTLVALAVGRMRNLETFIWDMPTGILRDVWLALSSLADRSDGQPCRLQRVAVRCHDNSLEPNALPSHHPPLPGSANPPLDHVERPSFSILPPLASLSVLQIDELQYVDELSLLLGRSQSVLKELRIGITSFTPDWVQVWEGEEFHQVDRDNTTASSVTLGPKRLGGVLGVLTAWIFDMRWLYNESQSQSLANRSTIASAGLVGQPTPTDAAIGSGPSETSFVDKIRTVLPDRTLLTKPPAIDAPSVSSPLLAHAEDRSEHTQHKRLSLETLELERVPLSIPVLQHTVDWTVLTSLTLLQCPNHEDLWKLLKRLYPPSVLPDKRHGRSSNSTEYKLKLTKIHCDTVSNSLLGFIKETLEPNSLKFLILQEASRSDDMIVPIDAIFRKAIRKHRSSLKKILIDSSERGAEGQLLSNSRSRRWMLTREMLDFITSGKMPCLQELGGTVDYRDWHFLLQHLPFVPHLRSLYIPYMANYVHGNVITEPRELAMQIVDIVALRPEIELCYLGIARKCFEILDPPIKGGVSSNGRSSGHNIDDGRGGVPATNDDEDDEDAEEDDDEAIDGGARHAIIRGHNTDTRSRRSSSGGTEVADDSSSSSSSSSSGSDSDDDEDGTNVPRDSRRASSRGTQFSLREILYYDDRVTIFKARHGRL